MRLNGYSVATLVDRSGAPEVSRIVPVVRGGNDELKGLRIQPLRFGDKPFQNELEVELQLDNLTFDKTSAKQWSEALPNRGSVAV